jgi:hypothetical protein
VTIFAQQKWGTVFAILFRDANAFRVFEETRFAETSGHATERAMESLASGACWWACTAAGGKLFVNSALLFWDWFEADWRNGGRVWALRLGNATSFSVSDQAFFA